MNNEKAPLTLSFPQGESLPPWAFFFAGFMASLLGIASVSLLTSAYDLATDTFGFIFFIPIFSFGFSYIHARKDIRLTLIVIGTLVLLLGGSMMLNIMMIQDAAAQFITKLGNDALSFLPGSGGDYMENPFGMTFFLSMVSTIPTFLTTWVIIRKKPIIFALLGYLPFLVCSFSLNYRSPTTASSVGMICGILMLFLFRNVRKSAKENTYQNLTVLFLPILAVLLFLVLLNPQSKYRNDEIARKRFASVRDFVESVSRRIPWGTGVTREGLSKVYETTYFGSVRIDHLANDVLRLSVETEDLLKAGNFTPPSVRFMSVVREKNDRYPESNANNTPFLYLKTSSMSWFDGYSWASRAADLVPADYFTEIPITQREARYTLHVTSEFDADYAFIPYYVDQYHLDPESRAYVESPEISVREAYNMNEKVHLDDGGKEYIYAYDNAPARYTPKWTQEYLDLIYEDCLSIPDETLKNVLNSGMLPDWYQEILTGSVNMPTETIVEKVVSYVRTLREYDAETPFPPSDMDFVGWFLHDSKTGFCVHYATTAVVLLRLLGIPARYVRGYLLTDVEDGVSHEVTTADAHAWIEYFHPDYGWVMDDPTPGNKTAASYYNFNAIVYKYGSETTFVTPRPRVTPTPVTENKTANPDSLNEGAGNGIWQEEDESFSGSRFIEGIFNKLFAFMIHFLIIVGALLVLVLGIRFGFQLYWKTKMRNKDINLSSRAYYKYFRIMAKILKGRSSEKGELVAMKAAFSREGITEEERKQLVEAEEKHLDALYMKSRRYRRNLFELIRIRKKLPF